MQFDDDRDAGVGGGNGEVDDRVDEPASSKMISKLCVIAVQMPTLWHQCKCDASYASWTRGS